MRVRVLFFGSVKEITGSAQEQLELPGGATAGDVFAHYAAAHPRLEEARGSIVLAVNEDFARADRALAEGDEVALLPPVSGGAGENYFALTREPIDTRALAARVTRGSDGAVVVFEGIVRDNSQGRATLFLDYEGYESMALKVLARLGEEIAARHAIGRLAMVHRLGRMAIGEASVVIVAAAPHRGPAFEAAREAIDLLKKQVPIWKKEHFADGEVWVEGAWDDSLTPPR